MSKNPTQWLPQSGLGYYLPQSAVYLVTNLGQQIVTNTNDNIVPNPYYVLGKYATVWSQV